MLANIVLISYLLMAVGLSCGTPIGDTRNIPSNMFKPLTPNSNLNQNNTAIAPIEATSTGNAFSEHSTGSAFQAQGPEDIDYDGPPQSSFPNYPNSFNNGLNSFRRQTFNSRFNTGNGFSNVPNIPPGFRRSTFSEPTLGTSLSHSIPLMADNIEFPNPSFGPSSSGFPDPNFGLGPSNNFYRSESYSYTSDGNGPPQIEQNVFDSRLGHGITNRNF